MLAPPAAIAIYLAVARGVTPKMLRGADAALRWTDGSGVSMIAATSPASGDPR